jgi:hypothetical protein
VNSRLLTFAPCSSQAAPGEHTSKASRAEPPPKQHPFQDQSWEACALPVFSQASLQSGSSPPCLVLCIHAKGMSGEPLSSPASSSAAQNGLVLDAQGCRLVADDSSMAPAWTPHSVANDSASSSSKGSDSLLLIPACLYTASGSAVHAAESGVCRSAVAALVRAAGSNTALLMALDLAAQVRH